MSNAGIGVIGAAWQDLRDDPGVGMMVRKQGGHGQFLVGDELTLIVADGLVHVSGAVSSQSERDAVRVVVEGVRGVKGVFDQLSLA
ncbi:hypothetical protein MAXJ12_33894 [Mesorhizobium alhagi CCNWXJ12-2]|uniref:BON domain-containing protein n=1 Tax=Mesorhizobium alhagi CCNWXJ12-2 TaxID=1107882 RepID=H0I2S3_9HYPH|nr:hypothetical protein MAXJ12_33894 [Mesorhizobium alhagi CCNWXJ12-2]